MRIDLKAMTETQLTGLIERAKQRQAVLEKESIAEVRKKIQRMIESEGLTLSEVLGELRRPRRTIVVRTSGKIRRH